MRHDYCQLWLNKVPTEDLYCDKYSGKPTIVMAILGLQLLRPCQSYGSPCSEMPEGNLH